MILQKNYYKETLAVSFQQAEISLLVERQKKRGATFQRIVS
jgi:hypothetical protein